MFYIFLEKSPLSRKMMVDVSKIINPAKCKILLYKYI